MEDGREPESLVKITLPCNVVLSGQIGVGKSALVCRMLEHSEGLFTNPPDRVIYVYSIYQPLYDELEKKLGSKITFRNDIPTADELADHYKSTKESTIVVLDDKMTSMDDSKSGKNLVHLTTVVARHSQVSFFFLLQNMYHNSSSAREIALNCQVNIIFRNDRSASQITKFASQVMPHNIQYFLQSYQLSTAKPHGYLLVDLCVNSNRKYMLRSDIIPGEDLKIYLPK